MNQNNLPPGWNMASGNNIMDTLLSPTPTPATNNGSGLEVFITDTKLIRACYDALTAEGLPVEYVDENIVEMLHVVEMYSTEETNGKVTYHVDIKNSEDEDSINHPLTKNFMHRVDIALKEYLAMPFFSMHPNVAFAELTINSHQAGMLVFQVCHTE